MSTALYVRTSVDDNDGRSQLFELARICSARGWCSDADVTGLCIGRTAEVLGEGGAVRVYLDRGESGANESRPQWDKLRADVHAGKVKRLLATELSRLGRKLGALVVALDDLHRQGCEVVIVRQGLDYSTPTGRLFAQVLGALAEYERELIGERRTAGIARARQHGTRSGRAIGRPKRAVDAGRVAELRAGGMSWRDIAQHVGAPVATVRRRAAGIAAALALLCSVGCGAAVELPACVTGVGVEWFGSPSSCERAEAAADGALFGAGWVFGADAGAKVARAFAAEVRVTAKDTDGAGERIGGEALGFSAWYAGRFGDCPEDLAAHELAHVVGFILGLGGDHHADGRLFGLWSVDWWASGHVRAVCGGLAS